MFPWIRPVKKLQISSKKLPDLEGTPNKPLKSERKKRRIITHQILNTTTQNI